MDFFFVKCKKQIFSPVLIVSRGTCTEIAGKTHNQNTKQVFKRAKFDFANRRFMQKKCNARPWWNLISRMGVLLVVIMMMMMMVIVRPHTVAASCLFPRGRDASIAFPARRGESVF